MWSLPCDADMGKVGHKALFEAMAFGLGQDRTSAPVPLIAVEDLGQH